MTDSQYRSEVLPPDRPSGYAELLADIKARVRTARVRAALVLEVPEHGMGSGLSHSPITPTPIKDFAVRTRDYVMPNNEVFAATRKLELGWMERKGTFKRAIITARQDGKGWEIQSEYEHE